MDDREIGVIKTWREGKDFGFIGRNDGGSDVFCHISNTENREALPRGTSVSFRFEEGGKGGLAREVRVESASQEGLASFQEPEGEREFGTIKSYNTEKGFAFIGRSIGGDDLFAHKKEFGQIEPVVGQGVSFIVKSGDKGDSATKVREEENVPQAVLSDEGREFGNLKSWIQEKGFGFIGRKNGGDDCYVHVKQTNGLTMEKGMCISFVYEDGDKGPSAKDLRAEDPDRVARVTAKKIYGKVEKYFDPTDKKPTNGFGFIVPLDPPKYGGAHKYYFHMSNIETPDEEGGLEPETGVSFIVVPAKKGLQAVNIRVEDPPEPTPIPVETSLAGLNIHEKAVDAGAWGGDEAPAEDGWGGDEPAEAVDDGDGAW